MIDLNDGIGMDKKRKHINLYLFVNKEAEITKKFWYVHTTAWLLLIKQGTMLSNTLLQSAIYSKRISERIPI